MTIDNLISCLSNMQQHEKPSKQIEKAISEGSKVITHGRGWKHFLIWTINFSIVLWLVFALPGFICVPDIRELCEFRKRMEPSVWIKRMMSTLIKCEVTTTQKPSLVHICDGGGAGGKHWLIFAREKNVITCAMTIYNDFSTCKIAKWITQRAIQFSSRHLVFILILPKPMDDQPRWRYFLNEAAHWIKYPIDFNTMLMITEILRSKFNICSDLLQHAIILHNTLCECNCNLDSGAKQ